MGPRTTLLALVLAVCCAVLSAQPSLPEAGPHVIIIGVDGLSVDGVAKARMPHLRELMSRAAWSLEARGVMPTLSSPNWASAINGAAPEQHGITSNGYLRHKVEFQPICKTPDGKFPTMFGLMRSEHPASKIAVFHDWDGFADLLEKHAPDVLKHVAGAADTTRAAVAYWTANRPDLMFIHLDNVDHAGHSYGWFKKQYYEAVEAADGYIGQVMDMVDTMKSRGNTFILVTSDHGGTNHGHGKNSLAELQIPWILAGPGVTTGQISAPVNIFDTALTVAWIFHLDPPSCWIGRPVMAAFNPALVATHDAAVHPPGPDCSPQVSSSVVARQLDKTSTSGVRPIKAN
ncbi:MAG: alkaline phosphatase [Bryobacteraceae bacterium]|jgi:hypothetical protein